MFQWLLLMCITPAKGKCFVPEYDAMDRRTRRCLLPAVKPTNGQEPRRVWYWREWRHLLSRRLLTQSERLLTAIVKKCCLTRNTIRGVHSPIKFPDCWHSLGRQPR